jgi:hypothetical protein
MTTRSDIANGMISYLTFLIILVGFGFTGCSDSTGPYGQPRVFVRTGGVTFKNGELLGLEWRNWYPDTVYLDRCDKFVSVYLEIGTDSGWVFQPKRQGCSMVGEFTVGPNNTFYTHVPLDLWGTLPTGVYRIRGQYCFSGETCPDDVVYSNSFSIWK